MSEERKELWQALRDIEAKYDVVLGIWQKEDVVSEVLMAKGWSDEDPETLRLANELADKVWTSDFKQGLRDAVNSPESILTPLVDSELYDVLGER